MPAPKPIAGTARAITASTWPAGQYTLAVTATGANGQPVTVSTQVQGTVSGVNLSQNPPQLIVGGQSYPISAVQSINSSSLSSLSSLNSQYRQSQQQPQQLLASCCSGSYRLSAVTRRLPLAKAASARLRNCRQMTVPLRQILSRPA